MYLGHLFNAHEEIEESTKNLRATVANRTRPTLKAQQSKSPSSQSQIGRIIQREQHIVSRGDRKKETQQLHSGALSADRSAIVLSPSSSPPARLSLLELNEFTTKNNSPSKEHSGIFDGGASPWNALDELLSFPEDPHLLPPSNNLSGYRGANSESGVAAPSTSVSSSILPAYTASKKKPGLIASKISSDPRCYNTASSVGKLNEAGRDSGNSHLRGSDTGRRSPLLQQQSPSNAGHLRDLIDF